MAALKITELGLDGVKIIEPVYFEDFRGYYCETYSSRTMAEYGLNPIFIQDNHSLSLRKGIIRGIHFQNNPKPQLKLVRCTRGRVMDYAVERLTVNQDVTGSSPVGGAIKACKQHVYRLYLFSRLGSLLTHRPLKRHFNIVKSAGKILRIYLPFFVSRKANRLKRRLAFFISNLNPQNKPSKKPTQRA